MAAKGDFIAGAFLEPSGNELVSRNPARNNEVVLTALYNPERIDQACAAADSAQRGWGDLTREARFEHLMRFRCALAERSADIADAICSEIGKLHSEAVAEAGALISRFDLVLAAMASDLREDRVSGHSSEQLRYHPLGVVGVIGPFNYPLHLCHAHVLPALIAGNTVVVKPSEAALLSAQIYAEAAEQARLPNGVINVVMGGGDSGARLARHPAVRGLCFTGSTEVGGHLAKIAAERSELLLALEMGGKNSVVVLADADIRQAAHEIVVGGFLTTGQRCTCTDRVLVERPLVAELSAVLSQLVAKLSFGDPRTPGQFAGPLASQNALDKFTAMMKLAASQGAETLVASEVMGGGCFVSGALHRLPSVAHAIPGYSNVEVFGPDLCIHPFDSDDEAIEFLRSSDFGLANSVFTYSDDRFERYYRETRSGILNRNRSTNQASPRLPFGGVGKSGNYRPAGAHAHRNVVHAVAIQENVIGLVAEHPMLVENLPPPGLDRLQRQHESEEQKEATRNLLDSPRPVSLNLPEGGSLPTSAELLARLYAGERVVREKKPLVFDHLRSVGPYMVSVDENPLSVFDGMSQTSTLCAGFSESEVVAAYVEGRFGDSLVANSDPAITQTEAAADFATVLRQLVPGLPEVTYANSGAEANEKALALVRANCGDETKTKVLAFEGSFHGRTLLSLSATWSPKKREPFQFEGYEAVFAPFPVWNEPSGEEPAAPPGFFAAAGRGETDDLVQKYGNASEAPLLAAEVESLAAVHKILSSGECFACIIEPMQSEGGDRYGTQRFFRALRLLTRFHETSLIFDEVQTGFGLGGAFAWHSFFNLVNVRGQPDFPDAVTFAKRAQLGVCMSRFADLEPTSVQLASLMRGALHAEMMSTSHGAERIQKLVRKHLAPIHAAFPHLVFHPRARGYAFAFDLPSPAHLAAYLGQRFWRGAVVFGAGTQTVRYRLNDSFVAKEIEQLFDAVRRSLSWLDAHPGAQPLSWEDRADKPPAREQIAVDIRRVDQKEGLSFLPAILDIELRTYEPARRTDPEKIRGAIADPESIVFVAQTPGDKKLVGFAIAHPLEAARGEEGPDRDPMLDQENSLYSMSLTVEREFQTHGIGRQLKRVQLRAAAQVKRADGTPRFRFVTGRNRVGHTPAMAKLNRIFGAHMVCVLTGQYEDPEGQAVYYRIQLPPYSPVGTPAEPDSETNNLAEGLSRPFRVPPSSLAHAHSTGLLYGPAVNKLTVMNYITPAILRALEWVQALVPELPHLYLTSSRDETVDKTLRILRTHRQAGQCAIGWVGGYLGHTTAAARSLSDPMTHNQGARYFNWPLIPHPCDVGVEASIAILRETIDELGAENILGMFFEPVQERTGNVAPAEFWQQLAGLREEVGVPLVTVETASAHYRSGLGAFAGRGLGAAGDAMVWWGGAHTGYIHVSSALRVAQPLAMVSTWDGDELSLVREHRQLRAARRLELDTSIAALDRALAVAEKAGMVCAGLGLYRVIDARARRDEFHSALEPHKIRLRPVGGSRFAVIPPLDGALRCAEELRIAFEEIFK